MRPVVHLCVLAVRLSLTAYALGCGPMRDSQPELAPGGSPTARDVAIACAAPKATTPPTPPARPPPLTLMTWNVEWFQDPSEGPTDDALQFARVLEVLRRTDSDLIALQEVCSPEAFARLDEALPRHAGVLAEYRWTQKLGLLYDASRLTVTSVTAIEGLDDAGRPPLDVSFELGPERRPLRVVVVHAKASGDPESRATRARFATGLAARLTPSESPTLIMGDFNDTLGASLTAGEAPPYAPLSNAGLVDLTAALEAPTASERSAGIGTLDHVVASAELATRVRPGSVDVLQRELLAHYPDFRSTVSDHFPVVVALDP